MDKLLMEISLVVLSTVLVFRQHASSIYGFVRKFRLGHFKARYEVELWYADCSHKYKINYRGEREFTFISVVNRDSTSKQSSQHILILAG